MFTRCENPKAPNFKYYGGRGIKICERWRDFDLFIADMGERPSGTSLDRFPDGDGDYEPGNCRWATAHSQITNRSNGALTEDLVQEIWGRYEHGENQSSIAKRVGATVAVVHEVLCQNNWRGSVNGPGYEPISRNHPVPDPGICPSLIEARALYISLDEASALAGKSTSTIMRWINEGRLTKYVTDHKIRVRRAEIDAIGAV
jgi:hypothetical protein